MNFKPPVGTKLNLSHPLTKGIVGYWLFNEGAGIYTYDSSGYNNTGTMTNMSNPATATSGWGAGKFGKALAFDGSNDSSLSAGDIGFRQTGPFTLSAWFKTTSNAVDQEILCWINSGSAGWDISVLGSTGKLRGTARASGGLDLLSTVTTVTANAWTHVVYTWSPTGQSIYVNGLQNNAASSTISAISLPDGRQVAFGVRNDDASWYLTGMIDSISVHSRALVAQEVLQLYTNPFSMFEQLKRVFYSIPVAAAGHGRLLAQQRNRLVGGIV